VGAGFFGWTLIQHHHVGVEMSGDSASQAPVR